jgi:hypothetical protein
MDILEAVIADHLRPLVSGGITMYPAHALGSIFDWAASQGRTIEWIEGVLYNPTTDKGQLSLSYMCEETADYAAFRETCLRLATAIQVEAAEIGMTGFFEIGISN